MKTSRIVVKETGLVVTEQAIYPESYSIEREQESGEIFMRTKLNLSLTFVRGDFDYIYASPFNTEYTVEVYDEPSDTLLATGRFGRIDCKFDMDNRICEVKVTSADAYDKILNGKDNEYDLVSLAPKRESVTLHKRAILQIYVMHDTKITNVIGNMSYEVDVSSGVDIESLSPTDMEDTYNFSQIGSGGIEVNVIGMPSDVSYLEGKYTGTYDGENTVLWKENEIYKIVVEKKSGVVPANYYWVFENRSGDMITTSIPLIGNCAIITKPSHKILPSQLSSFGYERRGTAHNVWYPYEAFDVNIIEKDVYARVLLNYYPSDSTLGTVQPISLEDFCASNLNYTYSMRPDGLTYLDSLIVRSVMVQAEPTKWGVNGDGMYFVQPSPMAQGDNVIPIGWNRWIPESIWLNSNSTLADDIDSFNDDWILRDAYPLWSAIKVLLAQIDSSLSFEGTSQYSQFLYGDASDIGGWVQNLLYITPITNVKKTYYNQAARKGKITLSNILDMLRDTCCLYWFIDAQKRLRIEHISWFKNGGHYSQSQPLVDLTSIVSPMSGKDWSFGTNIFQYNTSLLVKRYEFGWNEEVSSTFMGFPIDIKNKYVEGGKTEKLSATNFVSDIDLIISAPDVLSDDCFAVIGTDSSKTCLIQSIGNFGMDFVAPTFIMQNPYLSYYFTELAYWLYDMSGNLAETTEYKTSAGANGVLRIYDVMRFMNQSIKFPLSPTNVNKEGLITTALGNGEIRKAKYTPEDGMVEMELAIGIGDNRIITIGEILHHGVQVSYTDNSVLLQGFDNPNLYSYLHITANRPLTVTMVAHTETNADLGWANPTPLTTIAEIDTYAYKKVSGNGTTIIFTMDKWEGLYFGYRKDSSTSSFGDKIDISFVGR